MECICTQSCCMTYTPPTNHPSTRRQVLSALILRTNWSIDLAFVSGLTVLSFNLADRWSPGLDVMKSL